jgi:hypothetical protein
MPPEMYLLLIGELHGCSQHLQTVGQTSDREVIQKNDCQVQQIIFQNGKSI